MAFPRSRLYVGCMVAALASGSHAQTPSNNATIPSENALETWLSSGDPRLEAWERTTLSLHMTKT